MPVSSSTSHWISPGEVRLEVRVEVRGEVRVELRVRAAVRGGLRVAGWAAGWAEGWAPWVGELGWAGLGAGAGVRVGGLRSAATHPWRR